MIHKSIVIGIAGGSASGKSTFADALLSAYTDAEPGRPVADFHMDRYVHQDKSRGPVFFSESAGEEMFNWNHPDAVESGRLVEEIEARASVERDTPNVIIVEGLMTLHIEAIRNLLDLRLFIELDADQRALRRLLRNLTRGQQPEFIAAYYLECARVGHARFVEPSRTHADLILRGDADFARLAPMVVAIAEQRLSRVAP